MDSKKRMVNTLQLSSYNTTVCHEDSGTKLHGNQHAKGRIPCEMRPLRSHCHITAAG